jgi:hypothetical protein
VSDEWSGGGVYELDEARAKDLEAANTLYIVGFHDGQQRMLDLVLGYLHNYRGDNVKHFLAFLVETNADQLEDNPAWDLVVDRTDGETLGHYAGRKEGAGDVRENGE